MGKSCFCLELLRQLNTSAPDVLGMRIDLQGINPLSPNRLYGFTLLGMISTVSEACGSSYVEVKRKEPPRKKLDEPEVFAALQDFYREVRPELDRDVSGDSILRTEEFIIYVKNLVDIIRSSGRWKQFVVFYDEANKLEPSFSADLIALNARGLAESNFLSIFVASPALEKALFLQRISLGEILRVGPFESLNCINQIVARSWAGSKELVREIPVSENGIAAVWNVSKGIPYNVQRVLRESFELAVAQDSSMVDSSHVGLAAARLKDLADLVN